VLSVRADGLIRANEEFHCLAARDRSMPFGENNSHVTVHLLDFEDLDRNQYVAATQVTFRVGTAERRADLVLYVNGLPLVLVEAKTPVRNAVSWFDGAKQIHDDYERFVPELFTPNVFNVATEGKDLRYGAIHVPLDQWGPGCWKNPPQSPETPPSLKGKGPGDRSGLTRLQHTIPSLLRPNIILDILAHFTLFATDKKKRRLKVICRYQQYDGANKIVERVMAGYPRKGLIWHFQGSGKSLLMVFAAQKMRLQAALHNPTVLIIVDRVDLDTQISATFHATDIPNLVKPNRAMNLKPCCDRTPARSSLPPSSSLVRPAAC